MSEFREDVLHAVDIVDLVSKYVPIKKTGKNRVGLCPFHKEHTPSFTVAEDKQIFKCFGCGKWGNAITFLMEMEKIDYRDAVTTMAKQHNIPIPTYGKNPETIQKKQSAREKFKRINTLLQAFFVDQLDPKSSAYSYLLTARKLTMETIQTFGLWYAPDSGFAYIDMLQKKWFSTQDLQQAGVVKSGSWDTYAFFRDRLTFPIKDHMWSIVGFGARALHDRQQPKYLNTTETPLYDKSKVLYGLDIAKKHYKDANFLVVVEWYMDVIAAYQYGLPITVATCGTALTQHHIKLLKRHSTNVVFAFDNDSAWFDATCRWLKVAFSADVFPRVFVIAAPYKDIDEYLTAQDAPVTPQQLWDQTQDAFAYVVERMVARYPIDQPQSRKQCIQELFELLVHVQDYSVLLLYLDMMASPLGVSVDALLPEFKRFHVQATRGNRAYAQRAEQWASAQERNVPASPSQFCLWRALIHQDAYTTLSSNVSEVESYIALGSEIEATLDRMDMHDSEFIDESGDHAVPDASDEDFQQSVLEAQLWWERTVEWLAADKAVRHIQRFIVAYMQKRLQDASKSKLLSPDDKQLLFSLRKRLLALT